MWVSVIRSGKIFKGLFSPWDIKVLTELHADVLVGVFLPELLILVFVTHEGEDDLLAYGL